MVEDCFYIYHVNDFKDFNEVIGLLKKIILDTYYYFKQNICIYLKTRL